MPLTGNEISVPAKTYPLRNCAFQVIPTIKDDGSVSFTGTVQPYLARYVNGTDGAIEQSPTKLAPFRTLDGFADAQNDPALAAFIGAVMPALQVFMAAKGM